MIVVKKKVIDSSQKTVPKDNYCSFSMNFRGSNWSSVSRYEPDCVWLGSVRYGEFRIEIWSHAFWHFDLELLQDGHEVQEDLDGGHRLARARTLAWKESLFN